MAAETKDANPEEKETETAKKDEAKPQTQPTSTSNVVMEENVLMDAMPESRNPTSEAKTVPGSDTKKEKDSPPVVLASAVKQLRIGGKDLDTINDEHFATVRAHFQIPNTFAPTESDVSFAKLTSAGGKGGDPMTMSSDRKFFVKELNKADSDALQSLSKDLCQHIVNTDSLLSPIIAHFKSKKKTYMAMMNSVPFSGRLLKLYDLKGCADDKLMVDGGEKVPQVHKRVWNVNIWCGCAGVDRRKYFNGKLEALHCPNIKLYNAQREAILQAMKGDCEWLKSHDLMDYSLIVGIHEEITKEVFEERKSNAVVRPGVGFVYQVSDNVCSDTFIGIIDYLQKWGPGKTIAHRIKSLERNKATVKPGKYADRFFEHFEHVLVPYDVPNVDAYTTRRDERDKGLGHRCYPLVKR